MENAIWFRERRYGLGAGLPVAWQGWALLGGGAAVIAAASPLAHPHPVAFGAVLTGLALVILPVAAAHTRGGWRWRWGDAG